MRSARQARAAALYAEAQRLFRGGQWQRALAKMEEVRDFDPQFADPQEIAAKAQAGVEKEEAEAGRQKELEALYAEATRLLRAGQYQAALDKWDQVQARDAQYPDRERVQATARQKLTVPAKVVSPKRVPPPAAQPKQTGLPGWLWPVAGGAAVLVVIVVVIVAVLGGGENGKVTPTDAPRPTKPAPEVPSADQPPTAADTGDPWTRPADSMVMLYVPAGDFLMGSADADIDAILAQCNGCERDRHTDETPQHTVTLDAFWIDRTEVTHAQYASFLNVLGGHKGKCEGQDCIATKSEDDNSHIRQQGGQYVVESGYEEHPMIEVSWYGAQSYCEWVGARLPTEAEWEKAARGTDGRIYPWGDTFDGTRLNFCDLNCEHNWKKSDVDDDSARTAPAGSYPAGASPYGALDMAGNVWEWVADWYA